MATRYFIAATQTNFGKTGYLTVRELPNVNEDHARAAFKAEQDAQKQANAEGEARHVEKLKVLGREATPWTGADMRELVLLAEITED